MATRKKTDPEVDAMVESIRNRLMRAPDRAGALRYVHFMLGAWNGEGLPADESTTTPEDTLRAAGISSKRQARYQRGMSSLLAGRE